MRTLCHSGQMNTRPLEEAFFAVPVVMLIVDEDDSVFDYGLNSRFEKSMGVYMNPFRTFSLLLARASTHSLAVIKFLS